MKKLAILAAILTIGIALIGCDALSFNNTSAQPLNENTSLTVEDLALQAASINTLLEPIVSSQPLSYTLLDGETTEEPVVTDEVSELDLYLELMSQFLGNDNGLSVSASASDRDGYEYMVTYTLTTLYDGDKTYVLYYNEIAPVVDDPADDTPTTEDPVITTGFGGHDGPDFTVPCIENDDEAITAVIDGLLVDGDVETPLEGALIQNDTEEILRLYAYQDSDNFVRVSVQTDNEDQTKKFFYQIVEGGVLVSESKIRTTVEDDEIHIRLELVSGTDRTQFNATQETVDNITTIHIRYSVVQDGTLVESGNVQIVGTYDETTGETTFEYTVLPDGYQNGHTYRFEHQCGPYGSRDSEGNPAWNGDDDDHGHGRMDDHRGGMWNPFNWFGGDDNDTTDDNSDSTTTAIPDGSSI